MTGGELLLGRSRLDSRLPSKVRSRWFPLSGRVCGAWRRWVGGGVGERLSVISSREKERASRGGIRRALASAIRPGLRQGYGGQVIAAWAVRDGETVHKEGRYPIALDHGWTMGSAWLNSLAIHGHGGPIPPLLGGRRFVLHWGLRQNVGWGQSTGCRRI
jgi:hypothetical protein